LQPNFIACLPSPAKASPTAAKPAIALALFAQLNIIFISANWSPWNDRLKGGAREGL
jgi:hypothetical protein